MDQSNGNRAATARPVTLNPTIGDSSRQRPSEISCVEARRLVKEFFRRVLRQLDGDLSRSVRLDIEYSITLERKLDRAAIEILRRGIFRRELDLLVVGPLGQLLLVPADYAGYAAATTTLTTGKLDLEGVDASDPMRGPLNSCEGEVCGMREGQVAIWLADPVRLWRALAMLSGIDEAFSAAPMVAAIPASADPTELPAVSSRGRPPNEVWRLIEQKVFDWIDVEGEPTPGEQVKLEERIQGLLIEHKTDASERAIRDHVKQYVATYRSLRGKRSTDK
jgi:hypothetical protein